MRTNTARRVVAGILAMAGAHGVTTVLPSAPASAASTSCSFAAIRNPYNATLWTVRVDCNLAYPYDAFNGFTIYGSDPWWDDTVLSVGRWETPGLPSWRVERRNVNGFLLDEDWGTDELYAKAEITRPDGSMYEVATNEIEGEFSY